MSTKGAIAMRIRGLTVCLAALGAGSTGCVTAGGTGAAHALGVAMAQGEPGPSVVAGPMRVVGDHVNPRFQVELRADGGTVTVRFRHSRSHAALVRVDARSLATLAQEEDAPADEGQAPSTEPMRLPLESGRFVECWKSGDPEGGYRVVAQAWTSEGTPVGRPVTVSPADADVLGAPQLVAIDGEHVVVTFVAMNGDRADLLAVPLGVL